ncbi:3-deoxy-7-phosphoheptulonate synthase [Rhodococcoides kroppenstedtii]|uniref:3-deoxy-7-phosphoheptulonate synthase n=1 Tax=Rhodococcoides kroppenstedtii TaxID=293050 RepID=UPI00362B0ECC
MTVLLDQAPRLAAVPLPSPRDLRRAVPLSAAAAARVDDARSALCRTLRGDDDRLAVVVGPCSVHDVPAALEYADRLAPLAESLGDRLVVAMRVYVEKPRTTVGWKGLLSDPRLDGSHDLGAGLATARGVFADVVERGLPVATEFLDPTLAPHLADLVAYGAIGARTAASQIHRQMVSGLPLPVGIKNATDGDVQVAVDGVRSAAAPHVHPGVDDDGRLAVVATEGNDDAHVILRGGASGPNYDAASVDDAARRLMSAGRRPRVVIDASHGNSAKDHRRQTDVLGDVARRLAAGDRFVTGVMIESFLVEGRQDLAADVSTLVRGQSITDACLGWSATEDALRMLADAVSARRADGTAR